MRECFRKSYFVLYYCAAVVCIFLFSACFSHWTGEGTLTIVFAGSGGASSARLYVDGNEYTNFRHEVYLKNTDGKLNKAGEFNGSSGTINVIPGIYSIIIKGYGRNNNGETVLRSYGISDKTYTITTGHNGNAEINMLSAMEATNEAQLEAAFDAAGERELLVVVKGKIDLNETIGLTGNVTLIAHDNAEITSSDGNTIFFVNRDGILTLGTENMFGELTLTGSKNDDISRGISIIVIHGDGNLIMHNDVHLTGNTANDGGAVHVNGSFVMYGGTISGNTAIKFGGGVYVSPSGEFLKKGGIIYGNDDTPNANIAGGGEATFGHAVFYQGGINQYYRDITAGINDDIIAGDEIFDGLESDRLTSVDVNLEITVIGPDIQYVTISHPIQSDSSSVTLTIDDSNNQFNSYAWIINGDIENIIEGDEITLEASELEDDMHFITILAYKGNIPWSGTLIVVVNNGVIVEVEEAQQ